MDNRAQGTGLETCPLHCSCGDIQGLRVLGLTSCTVGSAFTWCMPKVVYVRKEANDNLISIDRYISDNEIQGVNSGSRTALGMEIFTIKVGSLAIHVR